MTLIYLILILGITIFIHELGHFIFAKRAGIYVYEFSLGMGPKLWQWHRKNDETVYSIRLLPIGGFVQMAGEETEMDEKIPPEKRVQAKTWFQRFMTVVAGVLFNFILAIIILFVVAFINGSPTLKPYIKQVETGYPASTTALQSGDVILKVDGKAVHTTDRFLLELQIQNGQNINLEVRHETGTIESITLIPKAEKEGDTTVYRYGFTLDSRIERGFLPAIQYAFQKFFSLIGQMIYIIFYLITGKLAITNLAGPVGIYSIVGESAKAGALNLIYLAGFLSINVGFLNLLPIPAFDGGRLLFMVIEKIIGRPINPKIENTIHAIGLVLLMILMIAITYNDILRLFS